MSIAGRRINCGAKWLLRSTQRYRSRSCANTLNSRTSITTARSSVRSLRRPRGGVRLSKRLSASVLSALYSFWVSQNVGLTPFAFYNPFDVASGQQIGGNYDPTGNNTQGRVTVVFRGNWAQGTDIARTNVQGTRAASTLLE
jgi:hypothetical protein